MILDAGLPRPKVQWVVVVGRKQRRLDLIFKDQGVVVETDGFAWHAGIESFEDDRERGNSLTASGFRILHWTWAAIHERPEELIAQLSVALNMRRQARSGHAVTFEGRCELQIQGVQTPTQLSQP